MTQQITYIDKETFQTSPLPAKNKATSGDYNEIKTVVNNNADLQDKLTPSPVVLTDGAAIQFDLGDNFFDIATLETLESVITLTLSNVIQGANQILSVKKKIVGDVTITLTGAGLSFYGYNNADLGVTPDIILSGALDDIFDLSFLARTATEIGVATGLRGN